MLPHLWKVRVVDPAAAFVSGVTTCLYTAACYGEIGMDAIPDSHPPNERNLFVLRHLDKPSPRHPENLRIRRCFPFYKMSQFIL
jgi:hypothetical protein